jgi:uncharacterized protein involved in exopolysaccharide biosynthesis
MKEWDYLIALRSRWQLIGLVTLTVLAMIVIWTWVSPREYSASATLLFDNSQSNPVSTKGAGDGKSSIGTQADIIRSTYVAQRVVRNLKLQQDQSLVQSYNQFGRTSVPFEEWLGQRLTKPLQVLPTPKTNVLQVTYTSNDPAQASLLATAFAEAYVQTQLQLRIDPARVYSQWFESQIGDARRRLEGAQARLTSFQQARGLIGAGRFDIEQAQLSALSQQLTSAQADAAQARARAGSNVGRSSSAQQSGVTQGLDGQIAGKSAELQQLRQTLGSRHPLVVSAQAELSELNARRGQAVSTAIAAIQTDSAAANARLGTLESLVAAQRERVLRLSGVQDQMSVLQRDVDSARAAYDAVTNRLNEVRLQSEIPMTNVSMLDRATTPTLPSSPNVSMRLLLGLLTGLLLGTGLAFALEWFYPHVRSSGGLEAYTGVPVLADLGRRYAGPGVTE